MSDRPDLIWKNEALELMDKLTRQFDDDVSKLACSKCETRGERYITVVDVNEAYGEITKAAERDALRAEVEAAKKAAELPSGYPGSLADWIARLRNMPRSSDVEWFVRTGNVLRKALEHIAELREAWATGAISEHDGKGGARSNRNVEVETAIRALLTQEPSDGK